MENDLNVSYDITLLLPFLLSKMFMQRTRIWLKKNTDNKVNAIYCLRYTPKTNRFFFCVYNVQAH